ncbi:esterase/lipase [Paraconexibacter sp. AEG42_29]|uniref:Esterase/lipase n=1 Tax=Paraconexibacter sp. AEG42_29 TaxID=2997339 RepID=A0AAU7B3Q5_9ACTN
MPFFEHDGNKLYYEDSGGDGPVVVLSHGAFLDHTMWDDVVQALSPAIRCLTWDERGHGMSECSGPFDYWDAAKDVIALMDACGVEQAVLAGMSQGGWLTQRAALASPDRVRGIVLTGTSVRLLEPEQQAGFEQLSQGWLAMGPVGEIAEAILGVQFAPSDYEGSRFIGKWQSKAPAAWTEVWATILTRRDEIIDRLGEITCPALFVHGTVDPAFGVAAAEEMSSLVADSRGVVVVDGGPHCLALTHPAELSDAIAGLVRDVS